MLRTRERERITTSNMARGGAGHRQWREGRAERQARSHFRSIFLPSFPYLAFSSPAPTAPSNFPRRREEEDSVDSTPLLASRPRSIGLRISLLETRLTFWRTLTSSKFRMHLQILGTSKRESADGCSGCSFERRSRSTDSKFVYGRRVDFEEGLPGQWFPRSILTANSEHNFRQTESELFYRINQK